MATYNLIETRRTGKPARFSANGKRISRKRWNEITEAAHSFGDIHHFLTRAWHIENGGTLRKNYSTATIQEQIT
jgi:hypothetical protein